MPTNLKGRHLLTLVDFTPAEIRYLLDLSAELKSLKRAGIFPGRLAHKNVALLFEKPSTRTRCAFVVACVDEGAHPEYLGKGDIQLGKKETVADTARVLGRMFDAIQFRGFRHETVETLAQYAGVPVYNGLTDRFHPTQGLADLLTIEERVGRLKGTALAYLGDARNNVAHSLLVAGVRMGMDVRFVCPESLQPDPAFVEQLSGDAQDTGARVLVTSDVRQGVEGAHALYTDVWTSMGEEAKTAERLALLRPFQINDAVVEATGNPDVVFLHCLPALHNADTLASAETGAQEVTDEVFESKHSAVFDQAENRMHTIKAVMVATIGA